MAEQSRAELKYLVERQREEIKTLNDVGRLLSLTTDPQEIVRLVASYLRQTFPLALCGVLLIQPRKLQLIQFAKIAQVDLDAAMRGMYAKASEKLPEPLTPETVARMLEAPSGGEGQWAQSPIGYLRSSYAIPLTVNNQAIGLLSVFSGKAEAFSNEEQHVIDIVADQLGAGLRNASLLEELKRAGELKNELLMVISHELRIPLTSIKEGIGLMLEGALGPVAAEQHDFLTTVDQNADRLGALVEKVVVASQLVTGQLDYTFKELELGALLADVKTAFRPLAESRQVALELDGAGRPVSCAGDAKRLKDAVSEIVENAVQATPAGGKVAIRCADAPGRAEIQISDTGPGIPPNELPSIFEQFRSIGGVHERKTGGLGLGLFIAHAIVTAHGGTITLDSQVGAGTRITLHLPKKPPSSP